MTRDSASSSGNVAFSDGRLVSGEFAVADWGGDCSAGSVSVASRLDGEIAKGRNFGEVAIVREAPG